jgi:hypothetical protein
LRSFHGEAIILESGPASKEVIGVTGASEEASGTEVILRFGPALYAEDDPHWHRRQGEGGGPVGISEEHKAIFDIFKQAIEDERKSQGLYGKAAALCDDDVMRKLFEELRAEEAVHEARLEEMYKDFRPLVTG